MKRTGRKMRLATVVGALYSLLLLCHAQDFICTAARNHSIVTYKVSDESRPADYKVSKCTYIWINATGYTVATNSKNESVLMNSSINKLMSSRCIENLICKQHCTSEITGFGKDFMANCTMRCAENHTIQGDNMGLIHKNKAGWLIFGIVMTVVILVGLTGFVLFKCRDKIPSCGHYRSVRMHMADQDQPSPV